MPYAAILNSRQSKIPRGGDPWVIATLAAVQEAIRRNLTIISSLGLNTWELITWATGYYGGKLLIHVPYPYDSNADCSGVPNNLDFLTLQDIVRREFNLPAQRVEFVFQDPNTHRGTKKTFWPNRDREIINSADVVYPVSIRPGGNLETLLSDLTTGKNLCRDYQIDYAQRRQPPIRRPVPDNLRFSTKDTSWDYLTHWTRAADGTWPGETKAAYYRDVAGSGNDYARSAHATLRRILRERLLRASPAHIRGGFPIVSFTALSPAEAVPLMRWRKRFVRRSFEPYGIAIRKDAALSAGIRPVIYGTPADFIRLLETDQPFFQNVGTRGGDWQPEKEWRHLGNLDISKIPDEAIKIIVHASAEIPPIRTLGPWDFVALCKQE